ncbi:MAG: 3-phosphoshikimate 1-carboxyvinyltransferase [Candidatus Symbiothrix sp.]|jgi:3-phosphoshikimate 1-carboxyvinyltransferase|nr:3-phosphoshikimate 1-carboxyvinyltransferase [Candidatus Symbiothrix sp.]
MIYKVQAPSTIQVKIQLPSSKSISNRVLILNALSDSPYPIRNLSDSDDTMVLFNALQSSEKDFNVGAAGTSMRFLTAYLAQKPGEWTITGTERMKNRPIGILINALRALGANIEYLEKEGFPPLRIHGQQLQGGEISLDGSISSQYISALMMIAPHLRKGLVLHLEGSLISAPYIRMTMSLMEKFGVKSIWKGQTIRIEPQIYRPVAFLVEGDWSAASYWLQIQALAMERAAVDVIGLEDNSLQGDAKAESLMACLVNQHKSSFHYDFVNEPDLAQTFVVTCCLLNIPFRFSGLQSLRIKETDRMMALQTEMRKLGYELRILSDNVLMWVGERCEPVPKPVIATYEDHRMAMAFAPACLKMKEIRIENPEVVSKSYPNYWFDLKSAGFVIQEES